MTSISLTRTEVQKLITKLLEDPNCRSFQVEKTNVGLIRVTITGRVEQNPTAVEHELIVRIANKVLDDTYARNS